MHLLFTPFFSFFSFFSTTYSHLVISHTFSHPNMRLIRTTSKRFKIEEFMGHNIPPYVILSHTWETEEITLQDIQRSLTLAKRKRGFSKIRGCCKLARARGIDYAWIDTCWYVPV